MANVKITALTGISSADVANEDVFVVVDLSDDETKKITLANIIAAVDTTQLSNVVALQGGLEGANSNQVAIATFADDTGTWQAGNLVPKANGVYSLGAADALWKDVFISAGSIKLGGVTISAADDEGITIAGASGDTTSIVTPTAGGAANVSANIALLESNVSILLGSTAGQNTRISAEEANVINLQTGLVGANTALTNEIAATNTDVTNLVSGIGGSNSRIAAEEANVIALQSGISGSNSRIFAEEANVVALQAGLTGANTNISSNDTDITNLVTGLGGSNTNITALEARRAANTLIFEGAFVGSNARIAAEESNVIALQGGIAGANSAISGNDTDITNLVTGLDGANTVIATKAATTYVDTQIAAIVDSAPETLNTLNELAAALGDDANFATTTATQIGTISSNTVNLQTGITGSNTNITANEARRAANTLIFLGAFTGSNARISAEESNVIALQGGIEGANTTISTLDTVANVYATYTRLDSNINVVQDNVASLVTGLDGSNTNITALEARRAANTLIFLGAHSGANTRISAEEANVIALQGGIAGANTNIASNDTDITNLVTGLDGSNTTIATKDSVANVYATYLVAKGGIDGANTNIASNDTDITNLVTGLQGANTAISGNDTDITNLVTGLGGANTNITAVESRRTANIAGAVSSITTSDLTASRAVVSDGSGKIDVSAVTATELGYLDGVTSAIQTQLDGKQASGSYLTGNETITLSGDVSGSGTTAITVTIADDSHNHVISNIDDLQTSLDAKDTVANVYATYLVAKGGIDGANTAISSNDTDITNLVTGLTGANTNISSNDTDITNLVTGLEGANTNISSNDTDITNLVTGLGGSNATIATKDSVANVYATYLVAKGGIDGANTNITALEARRTANIAGAISSVLTSDLTASRALQSGSGGKIEVSAVTATELGYLDGVTSAIQTQLDGKQASGSYLTGNETITLSGDVSGSGTTSITVTIADDSHNHVISNIDNLQTSLDAKDTVANVYATYLVAKGGIDGANTNIASNDTDITNLVTGLQGANTSISNITNGTTAFTGEVTMGDDLIITGNLTVNGTTVTASTTNTVIEDNLIELNNGAASNGNDSGIVIERGSTGDNAFMGWDESADKFIVGTTTATGASTGNLTITAAPLETGALGVTGNITVSGTVDGRDVATDGTKLDGIESGATADQTAADIRGLGFFDTSNDGSGSGLDADLLDGQQGSYYLAASSYTAADVLTKIKTVDGAGSGLDADLLDGQSSAYYAVESTRSSNAAQLAAGIVSAGSSGGGFATVTSTEHTTGTYNSYAIGTTVSSVNNVFVSINGVSQRPTEYVLGASGANVQFKDASLASGLDLELRTIS